MREIFTCMNRGEYDGDIESWTVEIRSDAGKVIATVHDMPSLLMAETAGIFLKTGVLAGWHMHIHKPAEIAAGVDALREQDDDATYHLDASDEGQVDRILSAAAASRVAAAKKAATPEIDFGAL